MRIISVRGPENERAERDLILEILGRDSNILIVDRKANRIMDCLHHIPEKETGSRMVLPGMEYAPPPARGGVSTKPLYDLDPNRVTPGVTTRPNGKRRLTVQAVDLIDECFLSMNDAVDAFLGPKLESYFARGFQTKTGSPFESPHRFFGPTSEQNPRRCSKTQKTGGSR